MEDCDGDPEEEEKSVMNLDEIEQNVYNTH